MALQQIVYVSRNRQGRAGASLLAELRDILEVSRRNNARVGVTGFLMMGAGWNVQILEGEQRALDATLERIGSDARHSDIRIVRRTGLKRPLFPTWSMGAALNSPEQREIYLQRGLDSFDRLRDADPDTIISVALALAGAGQARAQAG